MNEFRRSNEVRLEENLILYDDELPFGGKRITPENIYDELEKIVTHHKSPLIIIDTLGKATWVNLNKYQQVNHEFLAPLVQMARYNEAHILFLHHDGKAEREYRQDAVLGSTALFGNVDTLMQMWENPRNEDERFLSSRQRMGKDLPKMLLQYDEATHHITCRGLADEIREDNLLVMKKRKGDLLRALNAGVELNNLARTGSGHRGDPYTWHLNLN